MNNNVNINKMNHNQKLNYVKNALFNGNVTQSLDMIIKNEKKDLELTSIIMEALDDKVLDEKLREQLDVKNIKVYISSKILGLFFFYNKNVILTNFLKRLSDEDRKKIAFHEYQNNTEVAINSIVFNKYCGKFKEEALNAMKQDEEEVLMLTVEMEKYNKMMDIKLKKGKKHSIPVILIVFFITFTMFLCYFSYKMLKMVSEYDGLFVPGIYINEINLSGKSSKDLGSILEEEKEKIESGTIIVSNSNGDVKYTYKEVGIKVDTDNILKQVNDYNNNLSIFKKAKMIKENKRVKTFYLDGTFDNESIDEFIKILEEKLNTLPQNDSISVDKNHNVVYSAGVDGFVLDKEKTRENITKELSSLKKEITVMAEGSVVKKETKYEALSSINTKISSYTTSFNNSGNRGYNINHAASKLNGTVLMPGDTFSYLKVVGPYNAANGYLSAPLYTNGVLSTGAGGGVCQLATTLYNAQLRAGLEIVYRTNHAYAPNYVPKGLDATVYSTTTDYKFKNNYNYPIYIVAYSNGDYLTVDMWSSDKALGGKTYEPYSVYSNGGYLTYLKIIENGKVVEQKYLNKSFYKTK